MVLGLAMHSKGCGSGECGVGLRYKSGVHNPVLVI